MRRATETIARQWEILTLIPREPLSITTAEIRARLADRGHSVDVRTVQRDLVALESRFMLRCRTNGRTNTWFWSRNQIPLQSPAMSTVTAVTLLLVRDYLHPLLPSAATEELRPYFVTAGEQLAGTKLGEWTSRVVILQRGPVLAPPAIDPAVRDVVYAALVEGRQCEMDYACPDFGERRVTATPLGLIVDQDIVYVVATLEGQVGVQRLALHRMQRPRLSKAAAEMPADFSLHEYVANEDAFRWRAPIGAVDLDAVFDREAARHVLERCRGSESCVVDADRRVRLRTRVADTEELRRWLLGLGDRVEVLRPSTLRAELVERGLAVARCHEGAVDASTLINRNETASAAGRKGERRNGVVP